MSTNDVIQSHRNWLDQVRKALVPNADASQFMTLQSAARQQRIADLQRRIDSLQSQKSAAEQRFDDLIARCQAELAQWSAATDTNVPDPSKSAPSTTAPPPEQLPADSRSANMARPARKK